jgi:hypothetical protein
VVAVDDGFPLDFDPVPPGVGPAHPVEKHRAHLGVFGRATLRLVAMVDDEKSHWHLLPDQL